MSLVGILVALAILGVLATVVTSAVASSLKSAILIADLGEEEDLRRMILVRLDCPTTVAAAAAVSGQGRNLALLDRTGHGISAVEPLNVYKIGKWSLRADSRDSTTGQINILARKGNNAEKVLYRNSAYFTCFP